VGLGRGCGASLFLGASFPKYHLLDVAMSPPTLADVRCRGLIQRPHATGYAAPTLRAAGESSGTPPYQGAAGCRVLLAAEYSASPYSAGTFCTVELSGPYWLPWAAIPGRLATDIDDLYIKVFVHLPVLCCIGSKYNVHTKLYRFKDKILYSITTSQIPNSGLLGKLRESSYYLATLGTSTRVVL
jgi:hypothetical protein